MKRLLHLSWKEKLSVLIGVTLIGIALVTGSGFLGFKSITAGFEQKSAAAEYRLIALEFSNNLYKLENSAIHLSDEKVEPFMIQVQQLIKSAELLNQQNSVLSYPLLIDSSKKILQLSRKYYELRKSWVDNRGRLGHSNTILTGTTNDLKAQSFSMIKDLVSIVVSTQKTYVASQKPEYEKRIDFALQELEQVVSDKDWHKIIIGKVIKQNREAFNAVRILVHKEVEIVDELSIVFHELNQLVGKQNRFLEEEVIKEVSSEVKKSRQTATNIMLVSALCIGALILFSLVFIARQLTLQISQMLSFLKKVSSGDFTEQLSINSNDRDEFTLLRAASNDMVENISHLVSQVVSGSGSLLHIRDQLKDNVESLGEISTEVEEKTDQSAQATQQISRVVDAVAKHSVYVSDAAKSASQVTKDGGRVVTNCVSSMENIVALIESTNQEVDKLGQSGEQMLGIISVINGLADQTNLLALNAAIESARAGEAGRGFSVVADEVRALAQKTVSATGSISDIVQNFEKQSKRMGDLMKQGIGLASSGQKNANNASRAFESIEDSIQQVDAEMGQVVIAIKEISENTTDIITQVEHIYDVSEAAKETRLKMESYTQKLSVQAESLGEITNQFKL